MMPLLFHVTCAVLRLAVLEQKGHWTEGQEAEPYTDLQLAVGLWGKPSHFGSFSFPLSVTWGS